MTLLRSRVKSGTHQKNMNVFNLGTETIHQILTIINISVAATVNINPAAPESSTPNSEETPRSSSPSSHDPQYQSRNENDRTSLNGLMGGATEENGLETASSSASGAAAMSVETPQGVEPLTAHVPTSVSAPGSPATMEQLGRSTTSDRPETSAGRMLRSLLERQAPAAMSVETPQGVEPLTAHVPTSVSAPGSPATMEQLGRSTTSDRSETSAGRMLRSLLERQAPAAMSVETPQDVEPLTAHVPTSVSAPGSPATMEQLGRSTTSDRSETSAGRMLRSLLERQAPAAMSVETPQDVEPLTAHVPTSVSAPGSPATMEQLGRSTTSDRSETSAGRMLRSLLERQAPAAMSVETPQGVEPLTAHVPTSVSAPGSPATMEQLGRSTTSDRPETSAGRMLRSLLERQAPAAMSVETPQDVEPLTAHVPTSVSAPGSPATMEQLGRSTTSDRSETSAGRMLRSLLERQAPAAMSVETPQGVEPLTAHVPTSVSAPGSPATMEQLGRSTTSDRSETSAGRMLRSLLERQAPAAMSVETPQGVESLTAHVPTSVSAPGSPATMEQLGRSTTSDRSETSAGRMLRSLLERQAPAAMSVETPQGVESLTAHVPTSVSAPGSPATMEQLGRSTTSDRSETSAGRMLRSLLERQAPTASSDVTTRVSDSLIIVGPSPDAPPRTERRRPLVSPSEVRRKIPRTEEIEAESEDTVEVATSYLDNMSEWSILRTALEPVEFTLVNVNLRNESDTSYIVAEARKLGVHIERISTSRMPYGEDIYFQKFYSYDENAERMRAVVNMENWMAKWKIDTLKSTQSQPFFWHGLNATNLLRLIIYCTKFEGSRERYTTVKEKLGSQETVRRTLESQPFVDDFRSHLNDVGQQQWIEIATTYHRREARETGLLPPRQRRRTRRTPNNF
ncbi:hypothetical protein GCK72_012502 [Caenorhabditis remanei]|uniref:Uncharacterized protein n=1 Tax=Caenorhabditis remanei TaxID=31234 RepID=A0A6A5GNQ7_CAERE|nr:hypothetical protein GCK72_012502 [Caenorhabditis remanei]KAF1756049.1 hypothetical protein GCK72_012502 [Caenorhabditis remanei]